MLISVCMIVKNEEQCLERCLRSLQGIADELVIVNTGSTDRTCEIAGAYGARLFTFAWIDDFAAARNYSFEQAEGEYIYIADADEEIDEENRAKFLALKDALAEGTQSPEIVQMYYGGQLSQNSVYNYDREYRPKLFKRRREFVWEGAIHEQIRLEPVILNSDIEIMHKPHGQHAARDLAIFAGQIRKGVPLPPRLQKMYARELYMAGTEEDLATAAPFFAQRADEEEDGDAVEAALLVVLKAARLRGDDTVFYKTAIRLLDGGAKSSELCLELGAQYLTKGDPGEALVWYASARDAAEPSLDIRSGSVSAELGMAACYRALGMAEEANACERRTEEGVRS